MPSPEESNAAMLLLEKFQAEYNAGGVGLPPGADWVDTALAYMEHAGVYDDEAQVRELLAGYGILVEGDPPPPPEEEDGPAPAEAPSFDEALDIPDWWNAYREFAQGEYNIENPDFVDAVRYQTMEPRAIFDTFVEEGSANQVNLPSTTLRPIQEAFAQDDPGYEVFDQAMEDIKALIRRDSWNRYVKSLSQ